MENFEPHVDERAKKFFRFGYSGSDRSRYYFNTQDEGLRDTRMITSRHYYPTCAYCGHRAYSRQPDIKYDDYDVKGYTCVCKGAMDELEIRDEIERVEDAAKKAVYELKKCLPGVNREVLKKILEAKTEKALKSFEEGNHGMSFTYVEDLGINIGQVEI